MDTEGFYRHFQSTVSDIEAQIDGIPQEEPARTEALKACTVNITNLSDEVRNVVDSLPSRDRQTYSNGIKALSTKLDAKQAPVKTSKQRFAFKSSFKTPQKHTVVADDTTSPTEIAVVSSIVSQHSTHVKEVPADLALIADSDQCLFNLAGSPALRTLRVRSISKSVVILPTVEGPIYLESISNSIIVARCRQFRMHNSTECEVYLHCQSRPIIEDCGAIQFAPLDGDHALENKWDQVDDFKWLRSEPNPNWSIIPTDQRRDVNKLADTPIYEALSKHVSSHQ